MACADDSDLTGRIDVSDPAELAALLAAKNQRWVDAAQGLSLPVVTDLLRYSGQEVDR